MIKIIFKH